jgi:putative thioredoxin
MEHMSQQPGFSAYGAVDLSALSRPAPQPTSPRSGDAAAGAASYAFDVTEASFQADVLEQSMTVPVVVDFWAEWCGPCKQLSPILEALAQEYDGRWVLARVDVDAEQRLGAAFQVQSIPSVFAVVKGQPIPLFQGALPEPQVRQYVDELLRVAAQAGVTGRADGGAAQPEAEEVPEAPVDPRFDEAYDAIERGDFDAAAAAYRALLDESPADEEARVGLAQVELLRRTRDLDPTAVRTAAAERPADVKAQCDAADLDLLGGHVEDAFDRLVDTVRRTAGDDRAAARVHLVGLFDLVGPDDPRVVKGRRDLASALF